MNVQIIKKKGKPEWAVIPYKEYEKLLEVFENYEDINYIKASLKAIQEGTEVLVPGEVTFAVLDGTNPVRAWRQYRKIKMTELAKTAGISAAYLSQIETGKRKPTVDTLKSIAKALGIDTDMLI